MTIRKDDGRRVVSLTMQPELYERLQAMCRQRDLPVTVWVREAIKAHLEREQGPA
jgi:predicted DNA-binding protein